MLPIAEYAHNSWKHEGTQQTPHELLIGIKLQVNIKEIVDDVPATKQRLEEMQTARSSAQKCLEAIQKSHNQRSRMEIKVGQEVWLEGKNLHVIGSKKLNPRRYSPFKIMEQIGSSTFKLDLPANMRIHNVFHSNLLLPYKETEAYGQPFTRPALDLIDGEEEYEVESIKDMRKQGCKIQYLVHWKGYPSADDLWVDHKDLNAPDLLSEFYLFPMGGQRNV
jgi:hypothetical protein